MDLKFLGYFVNRFVPLEHLKRSPRLEFRTVVASICFMSLWFRVVPGSFFQKPTLPLALCYRASRFKDSWDSPVVEFLLR